MSEAQSPETGFGERIDELSARREMAEAPLIVTPNNEPLQRNSEG
jgi:hypothetical protein